MDLKSGWLEKRGLFTIWFSRFVRLQTDKKSGKHFIYYYSDKDDAEPKGIIDLENCVVLPCDEQMEKEHSFKIVHPERGAVYFQAQDTYEQLSWMRSILSLIEGNTVSEKRELLRQVTAKAKAVNFDDIATDLGNDWVDLADVVETVVAPQPPKVPQRKSLFPFATGPPQSDLNEFSTERLDKFFASYADVPMIEYEDDSDEEEPYIAPRGLGQLCTDIGVDPEDVSLLIWAYHLKAERCGFFTKPEFINGMTKLKIDSTNKLKIELHKMKRELHSNKEQFSAIYKFAFEFSLEGEQKGLGLDVASFLLNLLMGGKPHVDTFIEYLTEQTEFKRIPIDTWTVFLSFSSSVKPDLSDYDPTSCWPVMLDCYADWLTDRLKKK